VDYDFARPGAGSTGSPSCDLSFFCTSIWPISSAGDEAETGTEPLSAPQMPLNVSCSRLAARMRPKVGQ